MSKELDTIELELRREVGKDLARWADAQRVRDKAAAEGRMAELATNPRWRAFFATPEWRNLDRLMKRASALWEKATRPHWRGKWLDDLSEQDRRRVERREFQYERRRHLLMYFARKLAERAGLDLDLPALVMSTPEQSTNLVSWAAADCDWYQIDVMGGQAATGLEDKPEYRNKVGALREALRAVAAKREPSLLISNNFALAQAVRNWLVTDYGMDLDSAGRLPVREAIARLAERTQASAGPLQSIATGMPQHVFHGPVNFGGTQNIAGGNVTVGDQLSAGRDASVEQSESTAEKVWGGIKSAWGVVWGWFMGKP